MFQSQDARAEEKFKQSTVGLVSAEEFKKKRLEAEAYARAVEDERFVSLQSIINSTINSIQTIQVIISQ